MNVSSWRKRTELLVCVEVVDREREPFLLYEQPCLALEQADTHTHTQTHHKEVSQIRPYQPHCCFWEEEKWSGLLLGAEETLLRVCCSRANILLSCCFPIFWEVFMVYRPVRSYRSRTGETCGTHQDLLSVEREDRLTWRTASFLTVRVLQLQNR